MKSNSKQRTYMKIKQIQATTPINDDKYYEEIVFIHEEHNTPHKGNTDQATSIHPHGKSIIFVVGPEGFFLLLWGTAAKPLSTLSPPVIPACDSIIFTSYLYHIYQTYIILISYLYCIYIIFISYYIIFISYLYHIYIILYHIYIIFIS